MRLSLCEWLCIPIRAKKLYCSQYIMATWLLEKVRQSRLTKLGCRNLFELDWWGIGDNFLPQQISANFQWYHHWIHGRKPEVQPFNLRK